MIEHTDALLFVKKLNFN